MQREATAIPVSVCICTYQRPHLRETIASILLQDCLDQLSIEILVCDDDPGGSAKSLVEITAGRTPITIRYLATGANNIAAARNKCLAEAKGNWIAFIDDDEVAEPDWLSKLVAAQNAYNADVVKGYVRGVYPPTTPAWVLAGDPYTRNYGATGRPLVTAASGNVFFKRDTAISSGVKFDLAFGVSGGEDTDFFGRLGAIGARMIASRDAIVNEIIPPDRITADYLRRWYARLGEVHGRKIAMGREKDATSGAAVKSTLLVSILWMYPLTRILNNQLHFWAFRKYWYSRGVLRGLRLRIVP
jgi:succinoglycan biosynthesis protein ExoM